MKNLSFWNYVLFLKNTLKKIIEKRNHPLKKKRNPFEIKTHHLKWKPIQKKTLTTKPSTSPKKKIPCKKKHTQPLNEDKHKTFFLFFFFQKKKQTPWHKKTKPPAKQGKTACNKKNKTHCQEKKTHKKTLLEKKNFHNKIAKKKKTKPLAKKSWQKKKETV